MGEHQAFQQHIIKAEEELQKRDDKIIDIATRLNKAKDLLQATLYETSSTVEAIKQSHSNTKKISAEEIIELSHRIACTTTLINIPQIEGIFRSPFLQPFPDEKLISMTSLFHQQPSPTSITQYQQLDMNTASVFSEVHMGTGDVDTHANTMMDFGLDEGENMTMDFGLDEGM